MPKQVIKQFSLIGFVKEKLIWVYGLALGVIKFLGANWRADWRYDYWLLELALFGFDTMLK